MAKITIDSHQHIAIDLYVSNDRKALQIVEDLADHLGIQIGDPIGIQECVILTEVTHIAPEVL